MSILDGQDGGDKSTHGPETSTDPIEVEFAAFQVSIATSYKLEISFGMEIKETGGFRMLP